MDVGGIKGSSDAMFQVIGDGMQKQADLSNKLAGIANEQKVEDQKSDTVDKVIDLTA